MASQVVASIGQALQRRCQVHQNPYYEGASPPSGPSGPPSGPGGCALALHFGNTRRCPMAIHAHTTAFTCDVWQRVLAFIYNQQFRVFRVSVAQGFEER